MSCKGRLTAVACGVLLGVSVGVAHAADCTGQVQHVSNGIGNYAISTHFRIGHSGGDGELREVSFEYTVRYMGEIQERTVRDEVRKEVPGRGRDFQIEKKVTGSQPQRVLDVQIESVTCLGG